jgi:4-amino-4-deoxy-L-arabinose transferase-like glycosyltransferase
MTPRGYKTRNSEAVKSPSYEQPPSKFAFLAEVPLWFVASIALASASLVSLAYYLFARYSKAASHGASSSMSRPIQTKQEGLDIIKNGPSFATRGSSIEGERTNDWAIPALRWEQVRILIGPLLGLVIAYFAQGIFDSITAMGILKDMTWLKTMPGNNRLWFGAGLFLVSLLIWFFTSPAHLSKISVISLPRQGGEGFGHRPSSMRFYLSLGIIAVYFASILVFLTSGENMLVRILWGMGLVGFTLLQIVNWDIHPEGEESPRFKWWNWLALALILAAGFWLRFYQLSTLPDDFHGDMASYGLTARSYLLGAEKNIFGYGFYHIPIMGFLPEILTMAVFGNDIFGLQMSSVLAGMSSLLAIYLLTWRLFDNHRLAALATILTAINVPHIHFSRIAAYMDPWLFGGLALFLFVDGLKARRTSSFGLAGAFLGLGLQMYFSGRVLVFIIALFLVYAFFFQRLWIIQNKRGLVLMTAGILLAMGPGLFSHLMNWDFFISRSREVYIFSQQPLAHLLNKYSTGSALTVLLTQIKLSLLMFNHTTDSSTQFGFPHPIFASLVSPLLWSGVGVALRRWKQPGMTLSLIWLIVITILGSILTIDAPFWPRLVGIVPAAALLIALALEEILELVRKTLGPQTAILSLVLTVVFLAVVGYLNWGQYYQYAKDNASPTAVTGRYIGALPSNVTACGILDIPLSVRETAFLAWPHRLVDIPPTAPDSELDKCIGTSIVWAISPNNIGRLDAIRARWPNGILDEFDLPRRDYTMTFYLVNVLPPDLRPEKH